jgi:hypothetical protein
MWGKGVPVYEERERENQRTREYDIYASNCKNVSNLLNNTKNTTKHFKPLFCLSNNAKEALPSAFYKREN